MKIVRIADNAINIYITDKDLASRNLDVSKLKEGTHDFDRLIWDAIDHANIEFGHEFEDRQLNVVNKPDGNGGLILMISHDVDEDYQDRFYYDEENEDIMTRFNRIMKTAAKNPGGVGNAFLPGHDAEAPAAEKNEQEEETAENEEITENNTEENPGENQETFPLDLTAIAPEAFRNLFQRIRIQNRDQIPANQRTAAKNDEKPPEQPNNTAAAAKQPAPAQQVRKKNSMLSDWDVLIFPELNDMLEFLSRNKSFKTIASSLYTYRGAYYLVLKPNSRNLNALNRLEALVIDYNATYLPAESFLPLLKERGAMLMEHGAISKLINHFEL